MLESSASSSLGMANAAKVLENPGREARDEVVELLSDNGSGAAEIWYAGSCPIGIGASDRYARRLRDARQHLSHLLRLGRDG